VSGRAERRQSKRMGQHIHQWIRNSRNNLAHQPIPEDTYQVLVFKNPSQFNMV
jgi:hypothetical protein